MVSCREAAACVCHWAVAVVFFVVSTQQDGELTWFASF